MSEKQTLHPSQIRTDGGTQMRAELDPTTIDEYAQAIQAGATFPPLIVYYDGSEYWLGDGFHRLAARKKIFEGAIQCEVRSGTRRDAVLCAAGANATHGRRRTNADKRRSVETLLRDQEWGQWSDREIAKACCVDHKTVGNLRRDISGEIPQIPTERNVQRNGQTYTMQTTNIAAANQQRQSTVAAAIQSQLRHQPPPIDPHIIRQINNLSDWLISHGWGINYAPMPGLCYVAKNGTRFTFTNRDDKASELDALKSAKAHEDAQSSNLPISQSPDPSPRLLTSTETEAVIWRGVQHSGHTTPADQLAWLQNSTSGDYRKLLNPGVNFADSIFLDAYNHVQYQLRRQSTPTAQPTPAHPTSITTNTATELVWAALNAETFSRPILLAKIKFLKITPFAIFKSFLAKGETVTDETMLAALGKVEASLTLQLETCTHHEIGPDNHCAICGQPKTIPSHSSPTSHPAAKPAEPLIYIEAEPAVEAIEEEIDGDEYYTPPYIIAAVREVLGEIDLDPASSELAQTVVGAKYYFTKADDGLSEEWHGRVFHNPPYSKPAPFIAKLLIEYMAGRTTEAIVLVNNGTETQWGQTLFRQRCPVCFVGAHDGRGSRISFWRKSPAEPKGGNRYAQMIAYLGPNPDRFAKVFSQFGTILEAK